jgi:predicted acyltransferase
MNACDLDPNVAPQVNGAIATLARTDTAIDLVEDLSPVLETGAALPGHEVESVADRAPSTPGTPPLAEDLAKPARLLSLDAFRGLAMVLMLLVNNVALDAATPPQLQHAPWNGGIHLADLVFPWFLFCVGVAIPFAAAASRRKGMPAWRYDLKVLSRTVALVLLGCLLDSTIAKRPILVLGVLQTIGLAYLVGALLYDLPWMRRLLIAAFLLSAYWAAIKFLPIPGVGTGVFREDQNFIRHLNRTYLASWNLWGLPSVVPTAALVLIGTAMGDLLNRQGIRSLWRVAGLLVGGAALVGLGILWSRSLGFNKSAWTPSYILLAAGTGAVVLSLFYGLIDAARWRWWAWPLIVFGSNALLVYVASILVKVAFLQQWQVNLGAGKTTSAQQWLLDACITHAGRIPGGWIYTIGYILVWWLILWQLYRKRVFLRV